MQTLKHILLFLIALVAFILAPVVMPILYATNTPLYKAYVAGVKSVGRAFLGLIFQPVAAYFYNPRNGFVKAANTLTGLIPTIYDQLDVVSRELVGMIPAVALSSKAEMAAVGQTITTHVAPAATASDVTPGVTPPNDGDQTIGNIQMSITKARRVPVRWNGEESLSVDAPGGPGRGPIMADQFAQAFRTLTNEMEVDLRDAAAGLTSRAYGTAGTTPFAFSATRSGFEDVTGVRQILVDNGSPSGQMQLVLGTIAGAKFRALASLNNRADEKGIRFQEQGILLPIQGMEIRESGMVANSVFTKGTNAAATTNTAGYAVGATVITLASASTGTILAGDFITFAGDVNNVYQVISGDADVSNGGTITLAAPGLRQAIPAVATVISTIGNSSRNLAFHRNAIVLATRLPARPKEGDLATDVTTVVDPRSGLTFEIAMYAQYRQIQYEVSCAWGVKLIKQAHTATLLG